MNEKRGCGAVSCGADCRLCKGGNYVSTEMSVDIMMMEDYAQLVIAASSLIVLDTYTYLSHTYSTFRTLGDRCEHRRQVNACLYH